MVRIVALALAVAGCSGLVSDADVESDGGTPTADGAGADAGPPPPPPNIILILTDDQRWDAWGHGQADPDSSGRLPWMIGATPNMDRLAAEGVHFTNAFVVSALCSPSRAAFLTGRYNHLNGVVNNHTAFPSASTTFASRLRDSGWVTGYFGKWHMGDQRGRPGFDESASFIGQGTYFDCPFVIDGTTTQASQGWVDDRTGDYAIDFIERHRDRRFAMMVGFKSPHGPQSPPPRLGDLFPGIQNVPSPSQTAFAPFDTTPAVEQPSTEGLRNYSKTIVGVDQNLGRILDKLDELGLAEDTVVVFASDNGFMLGDHSRGDKRVAYEESIKIPLLLRYPRLVPAGAHVDSLVLNIDLAPTLLAFAGLAVPDPMQGGDWRGLVDGSADSLRSQFLYEYFYENPYDIPTIVALRTETHKLTTYPGHAEWVELFDLTTDRHETNNLAPLEPSAALLEAMRDELAAEKTATEYTVPPTADTPP